MIKDEPASFWRPTLKGLVCPVMTSTWTKLSILVCVAVRRAVADLAPEGH
jgi:hypothetical protein